MERLTKKSDISGTVVYAKSCDCNPQYCSNQVMEEAHLKRELEVLNRLYEYEDKLGTDLPPCKIGDKIYTIDTGCCFNCPKDMGDYCSCENWLTKRNKLYEETVNAIVFQYNSHGDYEYCLLTNHSNCHGSDFKKDWFLTKEEAELALLKKQGVVLYGENEED